MAVRKKNNIGIAIIIAMVGVLVIGGMVGYAWRQYKITPQYFNPNKKTSAERLYNAIMELDYDRNYPASPEDLMRLYGSMRQLLYGNYIIDDILIEPIVEKMRLLYGSEILAGNTVEMQVKNIIENRDKLSEYETYTIETDFKDPVYVPLNNRSCSVRVTEYTNNMGNAYWVFYLEKDPDTDRWKIYTWEDCNEYFEPLGG